MPLLGYGTLTHKDFLHFNTPTALEQSPFQLPFTLKTSHPDSI